MIQTIEYEKIPATILHQVTGNVSLEEIKSGIDEAKETISKVLLKYGNFNLIIDPRDHKFLDLEAHRLWKQGLQNEQIDGKVRYIALIMRDSPHTRAEKEMLETGTLRFFFDFDEGIDWLQGVIGAANIS